MDTPSLETLSRENDSITQKLYLDQLRIVRVTLFVIGAIALVVNWYRFANVPTEVSAIIQSEIRELGPDVVVEQEEIEPWKEGAIYQGRLIFGISACLGLGFILLGIFIYRAPVLVTLAGLFFFLSLHGIYAVMDSTSLGHSVVFKLVVFILLARGAYVAFAYQRQNAAAKKGILLTLVDIPAIG